MLARGGCEWVVDARGCDPARLADVDTLRGLFAHLVSLLGLRPVAEPLWHVFPGTEGAPGGGGITGMCMLAESHLTVHTFPEHGALCLNLFCCRPRPDWDVYRELSRFIGAGPAAQFQVSVRRVEREYGDAGAAQTMRTKGLALA